MDKPSLVLLVALIGILIGVIGVLLLLARWRREKTIAHRIAALSTEATRSSPRLFDPTHLSLLPEPVQRYFCHAIAPGTPLARTVRLTMRGTFRTTPTQPWMSMEATEYLSAQGLVWQASIHQHLLHLIGSDYYWQGIGSMFFSLWGVFPVAIAQSADTARSALGRLAGELIWLPSALLPENGVTWIALDEQTIQATWAIAAESLSITLTLAPNGSVLKVSLQRWGDPLGRGKYGYVGFYCHVEEEKPFAGFSIPTTLRAGYTCSTAPDFDFFRTQIESAEFA